VGILLAIAGSAAAQTFEAASIKPSGTARAGGEGSGRARISHSPVTLTATNANLGDCIQWAYNVMFYQITAPRWVSGSERYDIQAKAAKTSGTDQFRTMLKALLADRFKLAAHRESKEIRVYELTPTDKFKLPKTSKAGEPFAMRVVDGGFEFRGTSMGELAERLSDFAGMDRPVIDVTGVQGVFDFTLKGAARAILDKDGPTPFSIVQQLGLRLVPRRGSVDMLIVDRAEPPPVN
jgi:uncharacterized protein (TIGR03435 family)